MCIRDRNTETPHAARVAAIKETLDRGYGRPSQVIGSDPDNPMPAQHIEITVVDPKG